MAISSGAPAPVFRFNGSGFGPLYNALGPPKQAGYLAGFASGGGGAYLGDGKATGKDLMSAVERLEHRHDETPPRREIEPSDPSSTAAQLTEPPAGRGAKLRPLLALAPYVARYRGRA